MAVVQVTNTATAIREEVQVSMSVKNLGPATVYVDSEPFVTADRSETGGYPLAPGESLAYVANSGALALTLYGITQGPGDIANVAQVGS